MRLSESNLAAATAASRDASDPKFNRLHVEADGTTVASDGGMILAVEPVDPERAGMFPDVEPEEAAPGPGGVGVSLGQVAEARRAMPREKRDSLRYVQVTRCSEREVEIMATDGVRKRKISEMPMRGVFPRWRGVVAGARAGDPDERVRVCVDRRRLSRLLKAIDDACPDPGDKNPVYLEFSGSGMPIVARAFNPRTRQHVIGLLRPLSHGGKWLRECDWERGLTGKRVARKVAKATPTMVVNMRVVGEDYDVRVDRETKWGNPFRVGRDGDRDEVCNKHEAWFPRQARLVAALGELRGKRLGCWCAPERCHADFLARCADHGVRQSAMKVGGRREG